MFSSIIFFFQKFQLVLGFKCFSQVRLSSQLVYEIIKVNLAHFLTAIGLKYECFSLKWLQYILLFSGLVAVGRLFSLKKHHSHYKFCRKRLNS